MTNSYTFGGGSKGDLGESFSDVLPEGDYSFVVLECGEPYLKDNGRWVLKVKLAILPGNQWVWAQPWSGETDAGDKRDGIGDFLLAINRATTIGKTPDYKRVEGAKGKCRLKIGEYLGKKRNEVAFFHRPKQLSEQQPQQNFTRAEVEKAQAEQRRRSGGSEEDVEPSDIPF